MVDNPWFWEIKQNGSGPDYYLTLEFEAKAAQLVTWMKPQLSSTYRQNIVGDNSLRWDHIDNHEWSHTSVTLQEGCLRITRGSGNDQPAVDEFLQTLLAERRFLLKRWRVSAGGNGYATKYFRSGMDVASFQRYCSGEVKVPDFPQILEALKQALANLETDMLYRLGKPVIQGNAMTVPVLYPVPFKNGAWLTEPATQELGDVTREVSDRCNVPALASAASLHDSNNFEQVIGGMFYFGQEEKHANRDTADRL